MKTLKDLYAMMYTLIAWVELWGAEEAVLEKIDQLTAAARDAIMEEQGLTDPEIAAKLPSTTVLGEKSCAVLNELSALMPQDV